MKIILKKSENNYNDKNNKINNKKNELVYY